MDQKCTKCGGKLTTGRLATSGQLIGFVPLGEERKFRPRYSIVICDTCTQCGNIENIRVEKPEALR